MGNLSEKYDRKEFKCPCCNFDTVDIELVSLVELVSILNDGVKAGVKSGCRCPRRNRQEKGSRRSKHMRGQAADLYVTNPQGVFDGLCLLFPDKWGFGVYEDHIHVDVGSGSPRRWRG